MSFVGFDRAVVRTVAPGFIAVAMVVLVPSVAGARGEVPDTHAGGKQTAELAGRSLTLQEAIESALEMDENIRIERAALDSTEAAVTGAHGSYDPQLTLGAGWRSVTLPVNSAFSGAPAGEPAPTDRTAEASASLEQLLPTGALVLVTTGSSRATTNGAFTLLSPAYQTQLGIELRQPLLRDRAIDPARLALRVAASDRDRAAASFRREVIDTVAAVASAYWKLVAARRAVGVQEDTVKLASRQLDETNARISSGAAPETEVAQPQAELERRRGDLLAARETAARAETVLKKLILGDDSDAWSTRLEPVDDTAIQTTQVDATAAMAEALASRPELAIAAAGVERRKAEADYAHDQVRPALDLVASYDRFGLAGSENPAGSDIPGLSGGVPPALEGNLGDATSQLFNGDFKDARLAVELRVPIGNRAARADAEIARNAQIQAEADVTRVRKAIRAEVLDAVAATQTASARISAARAARQAADVQLSAEQDRFKVGLSTNFLVLTRQNDLAAARLTEIEALTDYRIARAELARVTGSLLAERHIELD